MSFQQINKQNAGRHFRAHHFLILFFSVVAILFASAAQAQVPADIETQLRKIGQIVDSPCTVKLYRPLMPKGEVADQYAEMQNGQAQQQDSPVSRHHD